MSIAWTSSKSRVRGSSASRPPRNSSSFTPEDFVQIPEPSFPLEGRDEHLQHSVGYFRTHLSRARTTQLAEWFNFFSHALIVFTNFDHPTHTLAPSSSANDLLELIAKQPLGTLPANEARLGLTRLHYFDISGVVAHDRNRLPAEFALWSLRTHADTQLNYGRRV